MSGLLASQLEKRFHVSQTPPGWFDKMFGIKTSSGVQVDEESAMTYSAVFACIRILSETLASLPLITYRRLDSGGKERASDFYLYPILHDAPNPEMTSFQFRETLEGHVASWGNGYAQIVWDQRGRVKELWPLRPDKMRVQRKDGQLEYTYRLDQPDKQGNLERTFPDWQILHIPGLGFDGIQGYSPITLARNSIGLGIAAEEFGARLFVNDAKPGYAIKHPQSLSDMAYKRLKKSVEEEHGGLEKSHKPMILEEGMELQVIGIPPEDAQFLETRKFQVIEICRWFNMKPHMIAELERATWSNIEQQSLEFVIYTMRPWFVRWEQCLVKKLLSSQERDTYFTEFLVDGLLRGDQVSRYNAYHVARLDGWMNSDEIRGLENMNPLPKGQGQVYLIPMNMTPAPTLRGVEAREISITMVAKAMRGLYLDTMERILRREKNDVLSAAKKYLEKREFDKFSTWLTNFYDEHEDFICRQMQALLESHAEALLPGEKWTGEMIQNYSKRYAGLHAEKSYTELEKVAKRGQEDPKMDILAELESQFEGWISTRARQIADQESTEFGHLLLVGLQEGEYERN